MDFWSFVRVLAEGADKGDSTSPLLTFAPLIFIAIFFYVLILRPQRREQAKRDGMLNALKKNDKVVTIGGIKGSVANISSDGQEVTLKVDDNTRIKFIRSAIQKVESADEQPDKPME